MAAAVMALCVLGAGGALVANAAGSSMPWAGPVDHGTARDVASSSASDDRAETTAGGQPETPSHLKAQSPSGPTGGSSDLQTSLAEAEAGSTEEPPTTDVPTTRTPPETEPVPTTMTATTTTTGPGQPPVAVEDNNVLAAGSATDLYVLDNDSDPDNNLDPATLSIVSDPLYAAQFSVKGDHITYRSHNAANPHFSPEDSFEYQICDGSGLCDTAIVTLEIAA
jgi:hypothetical protein